MRASSARNEQLTRGLVVGYEATDLTGYVLGTLRSRQWPGHTMDTLVLGQPNYRATLSILGPAVYDVKVVADAEEALRASTPEGIAFQEILPAMHRACVESHSEPLLALVRSTPGLALHEGGPASPRLRQAWEHEQRMAVFSEQFRTATLLPFAQFQARLRSLPCRPLEAEEGRVWPRTPTPHEEEVPVSRIFGTGCADPNWTLDEAATRPAYIYELAASIRDGLVCPCGAGQEIVLGKCEDRYYVTANGRHRTAAIKGLVSPRELRVYAFVKEH